MIISRGVQGLRYEQEQQLIVTLFLYIEETKMAFVKLSANQSTCIKKQSK